MKKKIFTMLCVGVLSVCCCVMAFAASSSTLEHKGVKATAKLIPTFQWAISGNDKATAITEFTTDNNDYRVAVRLERWDDKNTMGDYKYDSDSSIAQCNYTWTDVYAFKSRHSIDNSNNTVEYAVDSFNAQE
ncbi:MAG: hypothetical protein SOY47_03250 [Lachnospiraceae bacterium]|nr:hypothetical protein [Lachnospiraceae bacterium]